jgi:hypothetical protein
LAKQHAAGAEKFRVLVLPDDPLPPADAIVSVGHVVSYLDDQAAVERALIAMATALRSDGLLAVDICDLEWGSVRQDAPNYSRVEDDWAIITRFSVPSPDRFVREMTTFLRNADGSWRRDDERHTNVLLDTTQISDLLAPHGLDVTVGTSFGTETLPAGLRTVIGRRSH